MKVRKLNRDLCTGTRDNKAEQPASTKKHEAYMASRRTQMEQHRTKTEDKVREDYDRLVKQTRLMQRVKCSPALVNNSTVLK